LDQRPWYVDFFDGDYLRIFGPVLPSERTAAEVNAVVERLGLPRGRACSTSAAARDATPSPWPSSATRSSGWT